MSFSSKSKSKSRIFKPVFMTKLARHSFLIHNKITVQELFIVSGGGSDVYQPNGMFLFTYLGVMSLSLAIGVGVVHWTLSLF